MGFIDADTSTFTTGTDSAASFTTKRFTGLLHAIQYVPDTSTPLSTAAGLTVRTANSSFAVLAVGTFNSTVDTFYFPRVNIHSTAGSTIAGFDQIPLKDEGLTFTLSSGGATKLGKFRTFVG